MCLLCSACSLCFHSSPVKREYTVHTGVKDGGGGSHLYNIAAMFKVLLGEQGIISVATFAYSITC